MIKRIYQAFRQRTKKKKVASAASKGKADFSLLHEKTSLYRKQGCQIGKDVRLMGSIDSMNPHLISIGNYSVIGSNSALLTHCPVKGAQPCRIGSYVYLGWGVIVLPGVTIGDFSIIGAGSVVTKDVPEGSIAAGNPAKVIRPATEAEKLHLRETMETHRLFGWEPNRPLP